MLKLQQHTIHITVSLLLAATAPLDAEELTLDAKALFARGVTHNLSLSADQTEIELERGTLIEDDGPAAGYSYQPNLEKLTSGVWIKKSLIVPAPQANSATLLVGRGGELSVRINGSPASLELIGKQGNYWQAYRFSPEALQQGENQFVLTGTGEVWIARDDEYAAGSPSRQKHPNRSAKSTDGGKTWNDSQLGTGNNVDGEYYVRLFLDQYRTSGQMTLGVIDVGNLAGKTIGPPVTQLGPIRIRADAATLPANAIQFRARTGTTFVPNEKNWSPWTALELAGVLSKPAGRYLQLELNFTSSDAQSSPKLGSLTIAASPVRPADWTKTLGIDDLDNRAIVRSSIPFRYEPFDRPELVKLRREHRLDEVVAGAETEFELICRLAGWSATRWKRMHLKDSYPAYNGLDILKPHADGTPVGGFCQQFNVLFLQACESFGLVGRLVSIGPGNMTGRIRGGHETAEIWSNEYRKWVYVDGNTAWYAVDRKHKQPLSLWELRKRQLAALRGDAFPPIAVVCITETKYQWPDLTHWPPFVELRLIPRSNFLEARSPLPLNQGMRGWFWTGHCVWSDGEVPARMLYSNQIAKRENFEWTMNQAHLTFEALSEPGVLRVHVDSATPHLESYYKTLGQQAEQRTGSPFVWKLGRGTNRLRVVPRNSAERDGIPATVTISY